MLALAHRILSQNTIVPGTIYGEMVNGFQHQYEMVKRFLRSASCPVIVASNIANYYAESSKQDWSLTAKNYPCVAPPFQTAWFMEWDDPQSLVINEKGDRRASSRPGTQCGCLMVNMPKEILKVQLANMLTGVGWDYFNQAKWTTHATYLVTYDGQVCMLPFNQVMFVGEDGALINVLQYSQYIDASLVDQDKLEEAMTHSAHIPLITTNFIHCKNVHEIDVTKKHGPNAKWLRRKHEPEITYKVLCIDPNLSGSKTNNERISQGDRSGKALHICRGHFMHVNDDGISKGLFGRGIYGTFWVPAHTKGSRVNGEIRNIYSVEPPKA